MEVNNQKSGDSSLNLQAGRDNNLTVIVTSIEGIVEAVKKSVLGEVSEEANKIAEKRVKDTIDTFLNNKGSKSVDHFHKRLGLIMWNKVGMGRNEAGLKEAIAEIAALKEEFYKEVNVPGSADEFNPQLEKVLRVADFIDLGQLMAMDALQRKESCGGHFREEYQDAEGETLRDDENFKLADNRR